MRHIATSCMAFHVDPGSGAGISPPHFRGFPKGFATDRFESDGLLALALVVLAPGLIGIGRQIAHTCEERRRLADEKPHRC